MYSELNGSPIGKIKVTNQILGAGGHAKVYLAFDEVNHKFAAKKISKKDLSPELLEAYRNQYKIMSEIKSPYVVKLYDSIETDKYLCLIMELCDNDLEKAVVNDAPSFEICEEIVAKMCMAYYEVAKLGLVHRDIKPSNFLLKDNQIKLADFGTTKKVKDMTKTYVGTNFFMSPQIISGQQYSIKTDIWSLGVTAFWICYQKYPYGPIDKSSLNKCKKLPWFPTHSTPLLQNFINHCLQYQEEDRVAPRYLFFLINKEHYLSDQIKDLGDRMDQYLQKKWGKQELRTENQEPKLVKLRSTLKIHERIFDNLCIIQNLKDKLHGIHPSSHSNKPSELSVPKFKSFLILYAEIQYTDSQIDETFQHMGSENKGFISIDKIITAVRNRKKELQENFQERAERIFIHIHLSLKGAFRSLSQEFVRVLNGNSGMDEQTFVSFLEEVEQGGEIIARLSLEEKKELFSSAKSIYAKSIQFEEFRKLFVKFNNLPEDCPCIWRQNIYKKAT